MSTNFTIRIKGLAICYRFEDAQNVVFVCDEVHPLSFTFPKGGGTSTVPLREPGRDLVVKLEAPSIAPAENPFEQNAERIFNMAADYAHGPGALMFRRRRKLTDLVSMRVPTPVIGAAETTDNYYYVQEQMFPGAPVRVIDPVAREIILTLSIEEKLRMTVSDPAEPTYIREFEFDQSAANVDLDFDNDCHNKCTHNDFLDLYEVVIDETSDGERQFAAGMVNGDIPNARPDVIRRVGGIMSPEQGNCDPVEIDPPPGNSLP